MIDTINLFPSYGVGDPTLVMYANAPIPVDADGIKWGLFDLDGWNFGMDVKPAVYERPFFDGAVFDTFTYAARKIEIHGGFTAPTRQAAVLACRKLARFFPTRGGNFQTDASTLMYVFEYATAHGGDGLRIQGRPMAAIELTPQTNGIAYEFVVPILCADPRKYAILGQSVSAASVASCTGDGDTPNYPYLVRITGPVTNPIVTHSRTGWFLRFVGTVGAGTTLDINCRDHTISGSSGLTRRDLHVSSKFFPLLPGAQDYTLTGSGTSGATAVRVDWFDSYQ